MKPLKLTQLAIWLNAAIDEGATLDIDQVRKQAANGTLFEWLVEQLPNSGIASIVRGPGRKILNEEWERHENAVSSRKSFGVSRNGICLAMTYVLESLQKRIIHHKE